MAEAPISRSGFEDLSPDLLLQIDQLCGEYEMERRSGQPDIGAILVRVPVEGQKVLRAELAAIDAYYLEAGKDAATGKATRSFRPRVSKDGQVYYGRVGSSGLETEAGPTMIGGYEIQGVLGKGAMGVVYQARQIGLNRAVALKMILPRAGMDAHTLKRFQIEGEAAAKLQHPNIVQIFEVGKHDGQPYFSLEYVEGKTLAKKMDGAPQPPREAAETVRALAGAMQYAHSQQVIHRDLKPSNVMLTLGGQPKVSDFGLAKLLEGDSADTQDGMALGTPCYMAPEQASGKLGQVGPLADLYSLGAILYEMLTGRPPFRGSSITETMDQVRTLEPVPPTALQPTVPRDLETVCLKCLQKEPAKRYASAGDLADDLGRFLAGEPVRARPVSVGERFWRWCRRNPRVAVLGSGVFLFFVLWAATTTLWAASTTFLNSRLNDEIGQKEKARLDAVNNANTAKDNQKTAENNAEMALKQFGKLGGTTYAYLRNLPFDQMGPDGAAARTSVYQALFTALKETGAETADAFDKKTSQFAKVGFYQIMGDLYKKVGKGGESQAQFQAGYDLAKQIARENPESDKAQANWGMMAKRLGDIALELRGNPLQARGAYEKGRELQDKVYREPQSHDYDDLHNKILLSHHDIAIGMAELQLGRPAAARKRFEEALEFRKAYAARPNDPDEAYRGRSYVAEAYLWLGKARWHLDDSDGARKAFKESLDLGQALFKEKPKAFWYQIDLAQTMAAQAEAELRLGKAANAVESYRLAEKNLRVGMAKAGYESVHQRVLALILERSGTAAQSAGQRAEADMYYREALKLRKELVDIEPSNLTWLAAYSLSLAHGGKYENAVKQADSIRARAPKSAPLLLQAARCYAVCAAASAEPAQKRRLIESALDALRNGTAGDFQDVVVLNTDPDLATLQGEIAFANLLKEVAGRPSAGMP